MLLFLNFEKKDIKEFSFFGGGDWDNLPFVDVNSIATYALW